MQTSEAAESENQEMDTSDMSQEPAEQRSDNPEIPSRKRKKRAVLSCNDCRRRKLKCDRELPCSRCIKGGVASSCAYDDEPDLALPDEKRIRPETLIRPFIGAGRQQEVLIGQLPLRRAEDPRESIGLNQGGSRTSEDHRVQTSVSNELNQLKQRIAYLEMKVERQSPSPNSVPHVATTYASVPKGIIRDKEVFRGKQFGTQFYGPSCPLSLLGHFPELRSYMKEVYPNSAFSRVNHDLALIDKRAPKVARTPLHIPSLELLPEREDVDRLVQVYFNTFETTYCLFHKPTFWATYREFWSDLAKADNDFGTVLLAILAATICTAPDEPAKYYADFGSFARAKAVRWIRGCEAWIQRQSNKHRTLGLLQVRSLRLIALQTARLKQKEHYIEIEAHISYMQSSGMHRDPSVLGARCTTFVGEMRRRLWAAGMEIELQAAIERGAPSVLSSLQYDCKPPLNIHDSDLKEDDQQLPPSRPLEEFTDASYLHLSSQSIQLRVKLCALANDIRPGSRSLDLLQQDQEITQALEEIPKWSNAQSLEARTLLDVQLRQFIIILHGLELHRTAESPERRYSRFVCLDTSSILIEKHYALLKSGDCALCSMRTDYFRAAICIALIAFRAAQDHTDILHPLTLHTFDPLTEKTLALLEERAMRPGHGLQQNWYITAASSLVRSKLHPDRAAALKERATDPVSKLYWRILSLQEVWELAKEDDGVDAVGEGGAAGVMGESEGFGLGAGVGEGLGFDFGGEADWTLDDFWTWQFNPLD